MWNPFSRRYETQRGADHRAHDDDDREDQDELDLQDDDLVDSAALRVIARYVAEHDGVQPNGAKVDRSFVVVGSHST